MLNMTPESLTCLLKKQINKRVVDNINYSREIYGFMYTEANI